jgi:hypothetical protein
VVLIVTADDLKGGLATYRHNLGFFTPEYPVLTPFTESQKNAYLFIPFSLDIGLRFSHSEPMTFTITGLPFGGGLMFTQAGLLSGTPNRVDLEAMQPLCFTVSANAGNCGVSDYTFKVRVLDYAGIQELPVPDGEVELQIILHAHKHTFLLLPRLDTHRCLHFSATYTSQL